MISHLEARDIVARAAPTLSAAESLAVRCVAWHETNYGRGWKPPGVDSHNWGAITKAPLVSGVGYQGGSGEPAWRRPIPAVRGESVNCGPDGFGYQDSRPDGAGGVIVYQTCFRRYPTDEAGAADVVRLVLKPNVRLLIINRGLRGCAEGMYQNRYYTGTSSVPSVNIDRYTDALERAKKLILASTGEADPFSPPSTPIILWGILAYVAGRLLRR